MRNLGISIAMASILLAAGKIGERACDIPTFKPAAKPPRRLSVDKRSPHYDPIYKRISVKLNGVERAGDVHEYDMDAGWVKVQLKGEKGQWRLDGRGEFLLVTMRGKVEPYFNRAERPEVPKTVVAVHDDTTAIERAEAKRRRKAEKLRRTMDS